MNQCFDESKIKKNMNFMKVSIRNIKNGMRNKRSKEIGTKNGLGMEIEALK